MHTLLSRLLAAALFCLLILGFTAPAAATPSEGDQEQVTPFLVLRYQSYLECTGINKSGGELAQMFIAIEDEDGNHHVSQTFLDIPNGEARTLTFQAPYGPGLRDGGYCRIVSPEGETVFGNLVLREIGTNQSLAEAHAEGDLFSKLIELEQALELEDECIEERTLTSGMLFGRYLSTFECTVINMSPGAIEVTITIKDEDGAELASAVESGIANRETRTLSYQIPYEPGLLAESYCHVAQPTEVWVVGSHKLVDLNTKQTLAESPLRFDAIAFIQHLIDWVEDGDGSE